MYIRGNGWLDGGPAARGIEHATHCENGVAQRFGIEPDGAAVGKKPVFGIDCLVPACGGSASVSYMTMRRVRHDEPLERFQTPAAANQFEGEPVEKLRMRGPVALHAEVVRRADEALAEVLLPDPVYDNARQQMPGAIDGIGEPERERGALVRGVAPRGLENGTDVAGKVRGGLAAEGSRYGASG